VKKKGVTSWQVLRKSTEAARKRFYWDTDRLRNKRVPKTRDFQKDEFPAIAPQSYCRLGSVPGEIKIFKGQRKEKKSTKFYFLGLRTKGGHEENSTSMSGAATLRNLFG